MKRKRSSIFIGYLVILVSIPILFLIIKNIILPSISSSTSQQVETKSLDPNKIKDINLENLDLDGKKYIFKKGQVLAENQNPASDKDIKKVQQLVFFYAQVKEDPLFTSPDLDIEEFKSSIDLLKFTEDKYNEVAKTKRHFFPISFLEKIPEVTEIERQFLASPSATLANNLSSLYEQTAISYQKEIDQFIPSVKESQEISQMGSFAFIKTLTSPEILISDLEKISNNAKSLIQEAQNRSNCLKDGINCKRPIFADKFTEPQIPQYNFKLLDHDTLFGTSNNKPIIKGPYIVSTNCFGWGNNFTEIPQPFYMFIRPSKIVTKNTYKDFSNFFFKLGTQNFYSRVARASWETGYPKNLDRTYQLETTNYMCSNLEYQTKLATLDYFLATYKDQSILDKADIQNKDQLKKIKEFEDNFFSSAMPSENQLNQLANYYAYLYTLVEDQAIKDELLKRYLVINRQIGDFPLISNRTAENLARVILEEEKKPGFSSEKNNISYIYLLRTSWNILYFPSSPSFWRSKEKLQFLEKRNIVEASSSAHFLDYDQMLKQYSKEQIKQIYDASIKYNKQPLLY